MTRSPLKQTITLISVVAPLIGTICAIWLLKDPLVVWVSQTFLVWTALGLVIPYLLGGWTGVLWGGLVRIFLLNHVTWSVNSVCHTFGTRMFETPDRSMNNWLVGLLAFGEGWHNNHHAFPRSAFHGLRWWQFDLSAYIIRGLEQLGLVRQVWRIPAQQLQARSRRTESAIAYQYAPEMSREGTLDAASQQYPRRS